MNFCTLFDSFYLARGLALYDSLLKTGDNFHLYILAFDDDCFHTLNRLELESATVVSLEKLEDDRLREIKTTRSRVEYLWTCTPAVVLHMLTKFGLDRCTYLDADLFFYRSPRILLDETGSDSVIITEHRYTAKYNQTAKSGRFCVQFVSFRNTPEGIGILSWWRDACLDWCYARFEDGKFGDQKYLDQWPERFSGVHILEHPGGGVAPWNVQQYELSLENGRPVGTEKSTGTVFDLIFYHFHDIKFYSGNRIDLGAYPLSADVKELLYKPYLKTVEIMKTRVGDIVRIDDTRKVEVSGWYSIYQHVRKKLMANIVSGSRFLEE